MQHADSFVADGTLSSPSPDPHQMTSASGGADTHTDRNPSRTPTEPRLGLSATDIAEGGLLADVGIVLDLASIYLPIVGAILTPTVPTPFAILTLRRGVKVGMVASAVAMLLVTMLAGPHFGWRMGLEAAVGALMGWAMRRRWRSISVISAGSFIVATATFAAVLFVLVATGLPVHDVVQELRNGLRVLDGLMTFAAGVLSLRGQWFALRPGFTAFADVAIQYWPVLLYLYVSAFAVPTVILYYAIANSAARVLGENARPFPPRWIARLLVWSFRVAYWSARSLSTLLQAPFRPLRWLGRKLLRGRAHAPRD